MSGAEEVEIITFIREHPEVSERAVSRRFGRSRAVISRLRSRYALDKPQTPASLREAGASPGEATAIDIEAELEKVDQDLRDWWDTLSDEAKDELIRQGPQP